MADTTKIEWTDATWNPITGCTVHSAGCTNCYDMQLAGTRLRDHPSRMGLTRKVNGNHVWTGEVKFNEQWLLQPIQWKRPRDIFVCAHADLFHENVPDEWIDKIFAVMALAPWHRLQVLTKRSARMRAYCSDPETPFRIARAMATITGSPTEPEELKPIEGYPNYFVSSHGHVYSDRRGKRRRLKPDAGEQGHLRVPLFREGGPRRGERVLVHRLVLTAFDGSPSDASAQGRHLDGDPSNNAIGNLTWGEQSTNWDDSKRHGSFRRYSKLTHEHVAEIRARGAKGEAAYSIAKDFPVSDTQIRNILSGAQWAVETPIEWPLRNVWKGVSVEDQRAADERIPDLLATPAAIRWLSCEPLLGPVDLTNITGAEKSRDYGSPVHGWSAIWKNNGIGRASLDWIVCGGESGRKARPMHPDWARSLRDQCAAAGVPFHFKQWGEWKPFLGWRDGVTRYADASGSYDARSIYRFEDRVHLARVGKKAAGRLLDGVLHDGRPA